jgi:hypothetical protein
MSEDCHKYFEGGCMICDFCMKSIDDLLKNERELGVDLEFEDGLE